MDQQPPLVDLNSIDPSRLAQDTADVLVRAAVSIANLCDERRHERDVVSAEQLVDELCDALAERLVPMMQVFDPDDLNTTILLMGEAIDHVGFGDGLDMRDVSVFRRWADPLAFLHEPSALGDDVDAAGADLLREGVIVLEDESHRGARTITAAGPGADRVRAALTAVAPDATVDWVGSTPRRLTPVPCASYQPREEHVLRLYVPLEDAAHVDEIIVAETIDGATGRPLRREEH